MKMRYHGYPPHHVAGAKELCRMRQHGWSTECDLAKIRGKCLIYLPREGQWSVLETSIGGGGDLVRLFLGIYGK